VKITCPASSSHGKISVQSSFVSDLSKTDDFDEKFLQIPCLNMLMGIESPDVSQSRPSSVKLLRHLPAGGQTDAAVAFFAEGDASCID
jgi:hypothetical protein